MREQRAQPRQQLASRWNGLLRKSSAPASKPRTLLSTSERAVSITTGMKQVGRDALQPPADLEAVEARHHDVEQDRLRRARGDRLRAPRRRRRPGRRRYPSSARIAASSSRFSGWSSTARIARPGAARRSTALSALPLSPRRARGERTATRPADGEGRGVDRLGDVVVAAGGEEALAVAAHGVRGERDDRHARRAPGTGRSSAHQRRVPEPSGRFMSSSTSVRSLAAQRAPASSAASRARDHAVTRLRRAGTRPARNSGRCPQPPRRSGPLTIALQRTRSSPPRPELANWSRNERACGPPGLVSTSASRRAGEPRAILGGELLRGEDQDRHARGVAGSRRSACAAWKPSMPSMTRSRTITAGRRRAAMLESGAGRCAPSSSS